MEPLSRRSIRSDFVLLELYFPPLTKPRKNPKALYRGSLRSLQVFGLDRFQERVIIFSHTKPATWYYSGVLFTRTSDLENFIGIYHSHMQRHAEERSLFVRNGLIRLREKKFYGVSSYFVDVGGNSIQIRNFKNADFGLYIYQREDIQQL